MNRLLKWLLLLGFFLGVAQLLDTTTPPTPVLAETRAAPAPQYPQSDPGSYGYIPLVNVLWVSNTGLTAQPADTAVVYGANTRVTVPMTAVNQNGWFIFTGNKISSVSVNEYVNGSWQAVNVGTSISHSEPTSSADVTLPAGLSVGTHYYQATVHYPNDVRYSRVFTVNVAPQAVPATAITLSPQYPSILWGESTQVKATLTPENATTPINNWTTSLGSLDRTDSSLVNLTTTVPASATDASLKNEGTAATLHATSNGLTGTTQVTVGGITSQTLNEGATLSYHPTALDHLTGVVGTPTYTWHLYNANNQEQSWPDQSVTNKPTLTVPNASMALDGMYFQVTVSWQVTSGSNTTTINRYSNIAQLHVNQQSAQLIAVPNMMFAKADGQDPTVEDFAGTTPVVLRLKNTSQNQTSQAYDGNNANFLSVKGPQWSLAVAFTPFRQTASNAFLGGQTSTAIGQFNLGLNGQNIAITGDGNNQPVLTNQTRDLNATLNTNTTVTLPNGAVKRGTYQSIATWTVTRAPQ
ncbi:hypothetical protein [Lacticaseibacillus saniviri]|uniref:hypothetical protein n=1 Tax=Lacticaseibacillus saniviri TaxID=931533 RepID=UPI001EDEF89A|nr:hypothetical protein [Lacticaseibacillus saniviri]MCG4282098.1 hypothetical protein [Lacticaseibacillus saniviri]